MTLSLEAFRGGTTQKAKRHDELTATLSQWEQKTHWAGGLAANCDQGVAPIHRKELSEQPSVIARLLVFEVSRTRTTNSCIRTSQSRCFNSENAVRTRGASGIQKCTKGWLRAESVSAAPWTAATSADPSKGLHTSSVCPPRTTSRPTISML